MKQESNDNAPHDNDRQPANQQPSASGAKRPKEIGGRGGLDPTRYGDWEKNGRCIDF